MRGNTRRIGMINVSEVVRLIQEAERGLPQRAKAKREEAASPVIEDEAAVTARNAAYADYLRYLENAWKNPTPQPAPAQSADALQQADAESRAKPSRRKPAPRA
jgi:hypothetical protein